TWTDARLSWPRCRPLEGRCHPWLLVEEELARAIRHESAAALGYWWGVSEGVVCRWRKALGVGRADGAGSRRLIQAPADGGAEPTRGTDPPSHQVERRRRTAIALNLGRNLVTGYHGPLWAEEDIALLSTEPDALIAGRLGKTLNAVRLKREELGSPR